MYKLITGFLVFFVINIILGGIMEGTGGIAGTRLTDPITAVSTTISVQNTNGGFLEAGVIEIGREEIRYVSKTDTAFNIAATGRGYNNTEARTHADNSMVYTEQASVINGILGFDIASTSMTTGGVNLMVLGWNLAWKTVPKLITWDFAHLRIGEWVLYIRILLMAISAGLTFMFFYYIMTGLGGVSQSILTRV